MSGSHRHLVDDDDDDDDEDEEEEEDEEDDDVYMHPADMNPNERAVYRAACHAFKVSELNQ